MFLEFDFYKKYPNFDFCFSPLPGLWGILGDLGVRRIKNMHKTKSDQHLILGRGPFYTEFILNFGCCPDQPRLPAPFSPAVGQISKFCLICCFNSEKV